MYVIIALFILIGCNKHIYHGNGYKITLTGNDTVILVNEIKEDTVIFGSDTLFVKCLPKYNIQKRKNKYLPYF